MTTQPFKSSVRKWSNEEEEQLLKNPKEPIEGRSVGACRIRLLKILNRKLDEGSLTYEEIKEKYNVSEEQLDKDREISTKVAQKNKSSSKDEIIKQIQDLLKKL